MAAFAGVSLGPRMVTVGLPGSRWTRKKAANRDEEDDDEEEHDPLRHVLAHAAASSLGVLCPGGA